MDKVPPKLIKLHAKFFQRKSCKIICRLLVIAMNNSFNRGMFQDNTKKAWVSTLDKYTDEKHSVTKFTPVSF